VQGLGGAAEVQVFGEGEEVAQLAQFDHRCVSGIDWALNKHWTVSMRQSYARQPSYNNALPSPPCTP